MIYSVRGKLLVKELNLAVIECGGVGYACRTSYNTVSQLGETGSEAMLYTYLYVREDNVELFGFSAMQELNDTMSNKTFFRMLRSGMNIGRDAISTMTNTLILAYIGGSLATVLLLMAYNKNVYYLFNMEMITSEIVCSIAGSIGILAAVPATALISAYLFNKYEDKE